MSEEILKALMQLFAIIAKQDGSVIKGHETYVKDFLSSQLSLDRVDEYIKLYWSFFDEVKMEEGTNSEKVRTSMKDSVRTLAICKKINKTLAQKQKMIVLFRLIDFFRKDSEGSKNRMQIVETVADVFKIEKNEFQDLINFILYGIEKIGKNEIIVTSDKTDLSKESVRTGFYYPSYNGILRFHYIQSTNMIILKSIGNSENYLNGILIKSDTVYIFPQGSTLRLPQATIYYSNVITKFIDNTNNENFSFDAHIKAHVFPSGKQALHELRITESAGNLVGIMGASGSGKTTLLNILSGQDKPSDGEILINEYDLNIHQSVLKGMIGFVPQDDLLIEDLTVYQNLYYNSKLCFKDLSDEEVEERIKKTLVSLGLDEIRNIKVGNALNKKISGGQRKRLNIALELIREPNILFLDEPTSGLSSRDSENVMDLLKELTFKGKLIFVVIHQPSSDIFKMFDKLLILDTGGYATFYGNPVEGVMYFKKITNQVNCEVGECHTCGSVNPELIFNLIELKEIDEYGNYTEHRKIQPSQFNEFYNSNFLNKFSIERVKSVISSKFELPNILIQAKYFFLRDLRSKLSNKQYLILNALEVPLLVTFLSLIIKFIDHSKGSTYSYYNNYNIPAFIFMSIIAALLVGLTISAEEIFKDQKILKRERFLHLSRFSYLLSKITMLFGISLIHSAIYVIIGHSILGITFNYFNYFLVMFSVFSFANLLGLILSSTFNSPVTIYIIIPLIIIPQMILGGAMFNFNKLSKMFGGGNKVPVIANMMVTRWAYEAVVVDLQVNNEFEEGRFVYDKIESNLNYRIVYLLPKLEELYLSEKKSGDPKLKALIDIEIEKDINYASKIGFANSSMKSFKDLNFEEKLQELKAFYTTKFNQISDLKDKYLKQQEADWGGSKNTELYKYKYVNAQLQDIVTAALEKQKIEVTDNGIEQIIDPIYRDPASNYCLGLNAHFLSSSKNVFELNVPTFIYNLLVIWIINILLFTILYFDLLKKALRIKK